MASIRLSDFKVLSFDCYGTLIDWETGIIENLAPLLNHMDAPPSRDQVLEAHAYFESTHQELCPSRPYNKILEVVYRRLAEFWRIPVTWEACKRYGASVGNWPAFPDSGAALRYLKQHFELVILSNVDHQSFAGSNERLGVPFDAIYTAQDIGSYKPDARNFEYLLTMLGRRGHQPSDILHVAESLFHDHVPARQAGLTSCWIHRRHQQEGYGATMPPAFQPDIAFKFISMESLAEFHRNE